jgi:TRAP transporter TAXI family solute receptor
MKRSNIFRIFLVTVVLSLGMVPPLGAQVHKYIMGTGTVGGTFYPLGAAIAKVVSQYAPGVEMSIQSTGASTENCRLLGTQKVEFGLSGSAMALYAHQGKEPFSKPYPNIRAIGYIYPDVVQWVVMADSNIHSLQDMKGKKVGVGPVGSGCESTSRILFELAGISYKDFTPVMLPFGQSADRMRDRQLDTADFFLSAPNATVIDLATMHKIRIIEIKGEFRDRLQEKHPDFISITIPAGTYKGIDKEIETVGWASCLFTREDIPAEDVYKITKAIYEHSDEIAKINPSGQSIKLKDLKKGIRLPFHEGTLKYLKEKGM